MARQSQHIVAQRIQATAAAEACAVAAWKVNHGNGRACTRSEQQSTSAAAAAAAAVAAGAPATEAEAFAPSPALGRTRRARTGPSQQELDEAAAAFAEYEEHKQRAAAQKAAQAAQRAAGLQRKRAAQRVQSVLDADEGYFYEAPDAELEGSAGPSACPLQSAASTQQRHAGASPAHEDRQLQFEQRMRQHNEEQLAWALRFAPLRAAALRQDLERLVEAVQQRVRDAAAALVRAPLHVGCTAPSGSVCCLAVHSWRRVFLQTLVGVGAIAIPTFK